METVRKNARILVIDDHAFPSQALFTRDGYHFERWPSVKNLSQLTDGHYHVILLDVQGVGLKESPDLQGFGILQQIKTLNPAQAVILYSASKQSVSASEYLELADVVLDKEATYIQYKERVDELLRRRASPAYFITAMNRVLADDAALVPDAVGRALGAFRKDSTSDLANYLGKTLTDPKKVDTIVTIIGIGVKTVRLFTG